ncbi:putative protease SohB [Zhongshania aliphaticivorans]|uniref:Putative protease SohB n=1 Tax=Zhongshania aliphaticivorans TaxID=1470434 RepID=A0A5S9NFB3_9GAMM|nr:protease SohB [Zhongshania aliphaticivorans]CAA0089115.1 putative protease SohB [Zhongshania aliphaticivorans]CAA0095763.1 putative protease SohB [Zhongshania aliphaticivorans]
MEFLLEYGLFLAKSVTIIIAVVVIISAIAVASQRGKRESNDGHIEVSTLNHKFEDWEDMLKYEILDEDTFKKEHKAKKKQEKQDRKKKTEEKRKRLYVLDFDGDMSASEVELLRHEISAVLTVAKPEDEILLRLESPGGMVHSYGLASSQLQRIRNHGIPLTIAIDRVAASGGYMMACIGNKILAAPFAVIGSIGVVAQLPNFNRLLKKHDVDVELHTAGAHKRTLTMIGENTDEGRQKFKEELEETHILFKEYVSENRPQLDIEHIATGEVWYGKRALDQKLIDELSTSDDYLLSKREDTDLFLVKYRQKRSLQERLGFAAEAAFNRSLTSLLGKLSQNRYWG